MSEFIDAIIYVEDFSALVGHLNTNAPETLARDDDNNIQMPPNVIAFARTPAVVKGNRLLTYCRFTIEQAEQWRGTEGVEILAEALYQGSSTSDLVYDALFSNTAATAKYDSVYNRAPKEFEDADLGTIKVTPPFKFGVMA